MRSAVARALALVALTGAIHLDAASSLARAEIGPNSYESLFDLVLEHPGDPSLYKRFARDAEARGDLRHAFAALERVVLSSPGDTEAQAEFDRLRNKLMPAATRVTVEVGANYASNPRQLASTGALLDLDNVTAPGEPISIRNQDDAIFDGKVAVADERSIGVLRWRSLGLAQAQIQSEISPLNWQKVAVESGPVFQITPDVWLHAAGGGAIVWLDQKKLYDDALVSLTIGGLYKGLTQSLTARYTWRNANIGVNVDGLDASVADLDTDDAQIFDLEGKLVASPSLTKGDLFYFLPHLRVSMNDGDPSETIYRGFFDPDLHVQRPLFPGDYTQLGAAIAYYLPLLRGRAFVGAGLEVYERWYDESSSSIIGEVCNPYFCSDPPPVLLNPGNRRDTYIEPTAHFIVPNLLGPGLDLRFDYRYERNFSNASSTMMDANGNIINAPADFENHVTGMHVVGRY